MPVSLSVQRAAIYAGVLVVVGIVTGYWLTRGQPTPAPVANSNSNDQPSPTPYDPSKPPAVLIYKPQTGFKVSGLELPQPIQVNDINAPVPIIARTAATDVRWIISGNNPKAQPKVVLIPSMKMALVQPTVLAEDLIVIFAYTVIDGKPTEPAVTAIAVTTKQQPTPPTPEPAPKPDPVPEPAPSPKTKPKPARPTHITFIFDFVKPAPNQATIRNDTQFRNWLNSVGIEYHELNIKSEMLKQPGGLQPYVDQWGGPPVIVIQDDAGTVLDAAKFKDAASTKSFLETLIAQSG